MGARGFFTYMCCSSLLDSGLVVFPLDLIYLHACRKVPGRTKERVDFSDLLYFSLLFSADMPVGG